MGMLETMKKIAQQTNEAATPADFMFGTVTKIGPVQILVDNRFYIDESVLVIPRELRKDEAYRTHTHKIPGHTHSVPAHSTGPAGEGPHSHNVLAQTTSEKELETSEEVYSGLQVGDKVILLRNYGGQEYLVIGRV